MKPKIIKLEVAGVPLTLMRFENADKKPYWLARSVTGFKARVSKTRFGNWWVADCKESYFEGFSRLEVLNKAVRSFKRYRHEHPS